jgi:T5SS/PEP-CTERM-associated repeat protein
MDRPRLRSGKDFQRKLDILFADLVKAAGRIDRQETKTTHLVTTMKTKSASKNARKAAKNVILLAITALALSASPSSRAAPDCYLLSTWCGTTGDWFEPSNWCGSGVPHPYCDPDPVEVDINNGGTAQISSADPTAYSCELFLGRNSGQSGNLFLDHGTLDMCNEMHVGWEGKGTLSITNGGLVTTVIGANIAAEAGSNGTVTVDGGSSQWTITGGALYLGGTINGAGGTGLLTVKSGGTVSASNVQVYKSGTLTGNSTVTTTSGTTIEGTLARVALSPSAAISPLPTSLLTCAATLARPVWTTSRSPVRRR